MVGKRTPEIKDRSRRLKLKLKLKKTEAGPCIREGRRRMKKNTR